MKKITLLVIIAITSLTAIAQNKNAIQQRAQQQQAQTFSPEMKLRFAQRLIDNFYVD